MGGSARETSQQDARELGIDPIVAFDFDPATISGQFDLVLNTAGTLPSTSAHTILKPGGRIIDIIPAPVKFARSALTRSYQVMIAKPVTTNLEEVARAAGEGKLRLPIARSVPLSNTIPAITEFEGTGSKGGKLVITME